MKFEDIKKLSKNTNYIPGISTYCDRWCERCSFTSQCLTYAISKDQSEDPESKDINNEKFWKKLMESFQITLDLLRESAEDEGIDFDKINEYDDPEEFLNTKEKASQNICTIKAEEYADRVDDWFLDAQNLIEQKLNEFSSTFQLQLPNVQSDEIIQQLEDAVETIKWYHFQIYIKLMRAVSGRQKHHSEFFEEYERDSNGSAKVALLGIDRSLKAWGILLHFFTNQEDSLLNILVSLEQLKKLVENEFPSARSFQRPGFDLS
ncbi:hypothetical protein ACFL6I_12920 [candidate division KSB1 bacterium]